MVPFFFNMFYYFSRSNFNFSLCLKIGGGSAAPEGPEGDAVYLIQKAVAQICYDRGCSRGCTRASGITLLAHTFALAHISEGKQSLSVWTKASLTTLFVLVVVWRKELMILHFEYILTEGNFNVWTRDGKREVASTTHFTSLSFRKGKIFFWFSILHN